MENYHELSAGTQLQGKYLIEKVLGQGGFGITYLASHTALGKKVCIKELYISGSCTRGNYNTVQSQNLKNISFEDFKVRFINEARELAKFNHPGIVRVTDVFEENNTAYFVMDFVAGKTLKELVANEGPLSSEKAIGIVLNLLDAVEAVHQRNMLHRDIKPDNIIVTADGKCVLIDFGSARQFSEGLTTTQTSILTPGYAPLEQYSDKAKRGPFTDIYALGATIYFMLTGTKPIPATDRSFEALVSPELINPSVSKSLASLVMLAMNLKPEDRFQSIADMRQALHSQKTNVVAKGPANMHEEATVMASQIPAPQRPVPQRPAPQKMGENNKKNQNGKVILFIIIGVIVVGALAFIVGHSLSSNRTETVAMDSVTVLPDSAAIASPAADSAAAETVLQPVDPGADGSASGQEEVYSGNDAVADDPGIEENNYTIVFENKCDKNVDFCFAYYDINTSGWTSKGWWSIKAGETWRYTIRSSRNKIYWYAANFAENINWSGTDKTLCYTRSDAFNISNADDLNCSENVGFHALYLNEGAGSSTYHSMSCNSN